jgi:hypothetical protein
MKNQVNAGAISPNPFQDWGCYANIDANLIWTNDEELIGFHVTTPETANIIVESGSMKETQCRIGFDGRQSKLGAWVNCVPFIPYSIEQYMPRFECNTDMAVVMATIPLEKAMPGFEVESSWPFAQFALPSEEITSLQLITPEQFLSYRSRSAIEKLRRYIAESIRDGEMPSNGYAAQVLATIKQREAA